MSLNLLDDVRTAIVASTSITNLISAIGANPAVFTRKTTPENAPYPMIMIDQVDVMDDDFLVEEKPIVDLRITCYGRQREDYRDVESVGFLIRQLFHRKRFAISPTGYDVVQIVCRGPFEAPASDATLTGKSVMLRVTLS